MISAGDFKNGITLEIDGNVCQIVEFQHVKPGKGAAFVRTKYKNIITGSVLEKSFRPTEKFPAARIERVDMQYLYDDGDLYYFMNVETYDQVGLTKDQRIAAGIFQSLLQRCIRSLQIYYSSQFFNIFCILFLHRKTGPQRNDLLFRIIDQCLDHSCLKSSVKWFSESVKDFFHCKVHLL